MNGKRRPQWTELSRQPCWEYSDTEIEKRASSVLRWKIRYNSIRVTVEKGHLTLLGEVHWDLDCKAAEQTVRKLSGVTGVTNLLTTKGYTVHFTSFPDQKYERGVLQIKKKPQSEPQRGCLLLALSGHRCRR